MHSWSAAAHLLYRGQPLALTVYGLQGLNVHLDNVWHHDMQSFEVVTGDPTLCADLVHKAVDEADYSPSHIARLCVFKATLCVIALSHTACHAGPGGRGEGVGISTPTTP